MVIYFMNDIFKYTPLNETEFQKIVSELGSTNLPIEQTPIWGNFDNHIQGREFLGSFKYTGSDDSLIAIASATLYKQKGRNWIWIKHGPVFKSTPDTQTIEKICDTFRHQFSNSQYKTSLFIRLSTPAKTNSLKTPFEHTMYDQTIIIDLNKTEDEILSDMNQSGRQGYRRAIKAGVKVHEVTEDRIKVFQNQCYPILQETGKRGGFGVHPLAIYTTLLECLSENARLYVATLDKVIIAWAITTEYNKRSLYYYGGSNILARDTYAPYLLHVEIIKDMKKHGNLSYDFMGIAGKNYPSLANVTQFKMKFSKNITDVTEAYDLPFSNMRYWLFSNLLRLKRKLR